MMTAQDDKKNKFQSTGGVDNSIRDHERTKGRRGEGRSFRCGNSFGGDWLDPLGR